MHACMQECTGFLGCRVFVGFNSCMGVHWGALVPESHVCCTLGLEFRF